MSSGEDEQTHTVQLEQERESQRCRQRIPLGLGEWMMATEGDEAVQGSCILPLSRLHS